jgi:hypothetical protein
MGARITGGEPPKPQRKNQHDLYPPIEVGCLNTRAHAKHDVVNFKIPSGHKNAKCPECKRRAGRK